MKVESMNPTEQRTSPLILAIAWLVVSIPLGWGVYQSVVKALPFLYSSTSAADANSR